MQIWSRQTLAFMAVAEELHFGRAALRLHMSQPPLSQQVRQFEARAGTSLLERTTRSVRLTPAGRVLHEHLRRAMADVEAALAEAGRVAAGAAGTLRLGFTPTAAYRLVPEAVRRFRTQRPHVHLLPEEGTSDALLEGLLTGRIDLALVRRHDHPAGGGLAFEEVNREPLVVAMPAAHPLARLSRIPVARLHGADFIGFDAAGSPYFHALLTALFVRNEVQPRLVTAGVLPALLALVDAGMGVALVPASVRQLRPEGVAYRPLVAAHPVHSVLHVAWRPGHADPLVALFLKELRRPVK